MIFTWHSGEIKQELDAVNRDYKDSLLHCAEFLMNEIHQYGGPKAISPAEAYEAIADAEIILLVGDSFIAGFQVGTPWQYVDMFLSEEFYGPRNSVLPLNLEDFQDGAAALARYLGCKWLEFGTRSSRNPLALARKVEMTGYAKVSAVVLQLEIL